MGQYRFYMHLFYHYLINLFLDRPPPHLMLASVDQTTVFCGTNVERGKRGGGTGPLKLCHVTVYVFGKDCIGMNLITVITYYIQTL